MASWFRAITSPLKKACNFFNNHQQRDKKPKQGDEIQTTMDLQGEVLACGYEDVHVMWSILDKSNSFECNLKQ